ncbi:hypothetical protein D9M68_852070 [compost metagenome]
MHPCRIIALDADIGVDLLAIAVAVDATQADPCQGVQVLVTPLGIRGDVEAHARHPRRGGGEDEIGGVLDACADQGIHAAVAGVVDGSGPIHQAVVDADAGLAEDFPRQLDEQARPLGAGLAIDGTPDIPGDDQGLGARRRKEQRCDQQGQNLPAAH